MGMTHFFKTVAIFLDDTVFLVKRVFNFSNIRYLFNHITKESLVI